MSVLLNTRTCALCSCSDIDLFEKILLTYVPAKLKLYLNLNVFELVSWYHTLTLCLTQRDAIHLMTY